MSGVKLGKRPGGDKPSWIAPRIWDGGECWIIGGGPSLPRQFGVPESVIEKVHRRVLPFSAYSPYMEPIHDKHIIGTNESYLLGPWVDVVFFGDKSTYTEHRNGLANFTGLKITSSNYFQGISGFEGIKHLHKDKRLKRGLSDNPSTLVFNNNSGAASINLAIHFGATTIYLVGFDMRDDVAGNSHWFGPARPKDAVSPYKKHMEGFPFIKEAADRLGVKIINCSPDSAIQEFPKMSVTEVLGIDFSKRKEPELLSGLKFCHGWWLPAQEKHLGGMLERSKEAFGRKTYQYWNKLVPALEYVKNKGVAVDVGSHVGLWSYPLSKHFDQVLAFEPVPIFRQCWELNVSSGNGAILFPVGLGEEKGMLDIHYIAEHTGKTGPIPPGKTPPRSEIIRAPITRLDEFDFPQVDFFKIDCEGHELAVLKGAVETLKRCKPVVVVEQRPQHLKDFGQPENAAVAFLQGLGAKVYKEVIEDFIMGWD